MKTIKVIYSNDSDDKPTAEKKLSKNQCVRMNLNTFRVFINGLVEGGLIKNMTSEEEKTLEGNFLSGKNMKIEL